jgi:hypothetical protein
LARASITVCRVHRIEGPSIRAALLGVSAHLLALLGEIMVIGAERLQISRIMKEFQIAAMRYLVIHHQKAAARV